MFVPLLAALFVALPARLQEGETEGASPAPAPAPVIEPAPEVGVEVTFLANEGFQLRSGQYSILIDAFLRQPVGIFGALPEETHKRLVNALPPYGGLSIVLVSHTHGDHVQPRSLAKFMQRNRQAELLCSEEVADFLQQGAKEFETLGKRIKRVPLTKGSMKTLEGEGLSVSFFELPHFNAENDAVLNVGHLIRLGGLKILHLGDAAPTAETFAAYDLAALEIDLAIVPYWFFGSQEGVRVLLEKLRPRQVIMAHIPPANFEKLGGMMKEKFPEVVLFGAPLEKRTFLPRAEPK